MAHPLRLEFSGAAYPATRRGNVRLVIVLNDRDCMHFPSNWVIRDMPRRQTHPQQPILAFLFPPNGKQSGQIHVAYRKYRYRLTDIADHFGVHAATVRRRVFYWKTYLLKCVFSVLPS